MPHTLLAQLLRLSSRPVAITFTDQAPSGLRRVTASEPAGCGYWRRAAEGEVFYTVADDHKGCPVGAHTHNVALSPAENRELTSLLETMAGLKYLRMEEVPNIPRRKTPFQVAVYAPLDAAPMPPDVVLTRVNARQMMLLAEAAQAAWRRRLDPDHGSAYLCGVAGGDQLGSYRCQLWLHRQPRVHRQRR